MKRTLNTHISEAEHAWLTSFARRQDLTVTGVLRQMIREHMQRELADAGIEAGVRCSWDGCRARPAHDKSGRPDLCPHHQQVAAARVRELRRISRAKRRVG